VTLEVTADVPGGIPIKRKHGQSFFLVWFRWRLGIARPALSAGDKIDRRHRLAWNGLLETMAAPILMVVLLPTGVVVDPSPQLSRSLSRKLLVPHLFVALRRG
jgi:hypothetical protein